MSAGMRAEVVLTGSEHDQNTLYACMKILFVYSQYILIKHFLRFLQNFLLIVSLLYILDSSMHSLTLNSMFYYFMYFKFT